MIINLMAAVYWLCEGSIIISLLIVDLYEWFNEELVLL